MSRPQGPDSGKGALEFLRRFGPGSLVSLGCGRVLLAIDNHVRLMAGLDLDYYVGIDPEPEIVARHEQTFWDEESLAPVLETAFGRAEGFHERVRVFPSTWAEELYGIPCAAVVVQRPLPGYHFEKIIVSMNPDWVLQEGLYGCELQVLPKKLYRRLPRRENPFGLKPYPKRVLTMKWEKNYILWRRIK